MYSKLALVSSLLLPFVAAAPNPSCAPGGNFDLSKFRLQLPSGSPGKPDTISGDQLSGCNGFTNQYFYTDKSSGAIVMKVPGSPSSTGCVTTSGSKHCRTEFREFSPERWDSKASTNIMTVEMTVPKPDDSRYGTAIGQIFGAETSKPVAEMYYNKSGDITIGVNQTPQGGNQKMISLGNVPVNTKFTYVLSFQSGKMYVSINGKKTDLPTFSWGTPKCYFKAGDYNQGNSASEVRISAIKVQH